MEKSPNTLASLALSFVVFLLVSGAYYLLRTQHSATLPFATTDLARNLLPQEARVSTVISTTTGYALFKGYKDVITGWSPTGYIDDGIINTGPYAGYHRVIGYQISGEIDPGSLENVLITKDYKTFYLDSDIFYPGLDNDSSNIGQFDQTKVVGLVPNIPLNHPAQILFDNFLLSRQNFIPGSELTDFSIKPDAIELPSPVAGLRLYEEPQPIYPSDDASILVASSSASATDQASVISNVQNKYVIGSADTIEAADSNGVVFDYLFEPKEVLAHATSTYDYYFYTKADLGSSVIYDKYGGLFAGGCGYPPMLTLKNISINDLVSVGRTTSGTQVYTFKDKNHPINKMEYQVKISSIYSTGYMSDSDGSGNLLPEPTYEEYVARNPVLIVMDPWGRYVGLGEDSYHQPGGCGKPVIYFYPDKPIEIKVVLDKPTRFTVDIPTYTNGWDVMAQPDGALTNLKSADTDCSKLDTHAFGSEYAASACAHNTYPYIYWAGQVESPYPQAQEGWVVRRNDLQSFLESKLSFIGLTNREIADMTSYWVPELRQVQSDYYRISLFDTADMNNFAPMSINPIPDTLIRVFLDWAPLSNGKTQIKPETLTHINRQGFTAVEWGGLKRLPQNISIQ